MKNHKASTSNKKSIANEKQIYADRQILNKKNPEFERRQLYTDQEASAYLRISQITLWRLRKAGKISFHRMGSKIIYTSDDLENYLQSTKKEAFGCNA